jgi:molybdopterin converting factor subunit 1
VKVRVLYFAVTRDLAGTSEEELELDEGSTIATARRAIEAKHPTLSASDARLRVAKNEAFATDSESLAQGDVLALIPPVAGG